MLEEVVAAAIGTKQLVINCFLISFEMGCHQLQVVVMLIFVKVLGCYGCLEMERNALLQLKASFGYHSNPFFLPSWGSDTFCCNWERVKCDASSGRIINLDLSFLLVWSPNRWSLNASLFLPFQELENLDLSYNRLKNWVDNQGFEKLAVLRKLKFLDLSDNVYGMELLPSLAALSSLTSLNLRYNLLMGEINIQELRNLTNLKELNMAYCHIFSFSSSFNGFSSLKYLNLEGNELRGLPNISGRHRLKNLEELYLSGNNNVDSKIFQNVETMTTLKVLSLSRCGLTGTLSTTGGICKLKILQMLDISSNYLSGSLPWCLKNLTSLRQLYLSDNHFIGDVSSSPLTVLTSIQDLDVDNNHFRIPISLEPFLNHSKLKYFHGDNNEVYAEAAVRNSIPTFQLQLFHLSGNGYGGAFPRFLYHQHDLQSVNLSHVEIRGEFPLWLLDNNTKLELFLANTSLSGYLNLPTHAHPSLSHLDISSNHFHGHVPIDFGTYMPQLTFLDMSNNRFSGSLPSTLGNLSLDTLKLDGNMFTGTIPSRVFNIQQSLVILDVRDNSLSGNVPDWVGNMSTLQYLVLSENNLSGFISTWLKDLENLELLDLSDNNFSGSLPSSFSPLSLNQVYLSKNKLKGPLREAFRNSTRLTVLYLSHNYFTGRIPKSIDRFSQLSFLLLSYNYLEGEIPIQMCRMDQISLIDLSHNKLSGQIPPCLVCSSSWYRQTEGVANWSWDQPQNPLEITTKKLSMKYQGTLLTFISGIDLSSNNFIGHIPSKIGNLSQIKMLNLSHNSFSGPIPISFSNLKEIESLDLSYNKLEGEIPPQLINLYSLEVFSVAHNNLSGSTPVRTGQFGTFDESSYEENPFLCGLPLPKSCTAALPPPPVPSASTEEEDFMDMEVFYVSFAVSYIIVVLAIAAILFVNPYWRRAWFYMIEVNMTDFYYFVVDNCRRL